MALSTDSRLPRLALSGLLATGLVIAVGIPALLAYRFGNPGLRRGEFLACQALPYLLCAVLWLPWRRRPHVVTGCVFAGVPVAISAFMFLPVLLSPNWLGGDMTPLAMMAVNLAVSAGIAALSPVAFLLLSIRATPD